MATARGRRTKAALIDAAAAILETDGFAALSHRAVASRAGMPLGATTYHFDSLDDLVGQAMWRIAEANLAHAREAAGRMAHDTPDTARIAEVVVDMTAGPEDADERSRILTFYERFVQAGRHPALAPLLRSWNGEMVDLLDGLLRRCGRTGGTERARRLLALADGTLINAVAEGEQDPRAAAIHRISGALPGLLGD